MSAPRPSAADALVHIASARLAGGGVDAGSAAPERYQVVVHVDRELTSPDLALAATLEDGTHVSAATLRRVACDGGVVAAVVDWLHGGRTSLDNLVLLCPFHHRQVHEGGFSLRLTADAEVEVHAPGGTRLPAQPMLAADLGPVDWRSDWWDGGGASARIDAWTTTPSWDGEPVDYEAAVDALLPQ